MKRSELRYVLRLLGLLLILLSGSMGVALAWELYEYFFVISQWENGPEVIRAFLLSIGIGSILGLGLFFGNRNVKGRLGRKQALLLVSLAWFAGAAISALPFWFWANFHTFISGQDTAFTSYVNSYFEAMSGLTTTGASILSQIESIPRGILFWRAFTHWLGGLGIVVIFVAVLPVIGGGRKRLFRFESTGITNDGVTPNIQETSRVLLIIYLIFTFAEILCLKVFGPELRWFDAITLTFATLATGGYSPLNSSAGGLNAAVQWVIIAFMVLAGVNFGLYHYLWRGKFKDVFENAELRWYLAIMLVATVIIAISIYGTSYMDTSGLSVTADLSRAIRDASFQGASIQTTTGFGTANFEQWGVLPKIILLMLMFVGGCGGSTGGGIKVIRVLGAVKIMWVEVEKAFRPNVLRPVNIGHHNVEYNQRISILAYVLGILLLTAIGSTLLILTETHISGTSAVTAAVSALNNIGPGLGAVGPVENFAWFSDSGKLLLCLMMAIGRLEVFAVLVIFMPRFWRTC